MRNAANGLKERGTGQNPNSRARVAGDFSVISRVPQGQQLGQCPMARGGCYHNCQGVFGTGTCNPGTCSLMVPVRSERPRGAKGGYDTSRALMHTPGWLRYSSG